jgi:hypothetical protein
MHKKHARQSLALSALICALVLAGCGGGGGGDNAANAAAGGTGTTDSGAGTDTGTGTDTGASTNTGADTSTAATPFTVQANYAQGTELDYVASSGSLVRITLGAPITIGGVTLYATTATQSTATGTTPYALRWKYLGSANGAIIGSTDGQAVANIYGPGGTQAVGMFTSLDAQRKYTPSATTLSVNGYGTLSVVGGYGTSVSTGGCHATAGVQICSDFSATNTTSEYFMNGIGPAGFSATSSYLSTGGGIGSAGSSSSSLMLVHSNLTPADGTALPDFRSSTAPDLPQGYDTAILAAQNSLLYAITSVGDQVKVSVLDPSTATPAWSEESSTAAPTGLTLSSAVTSTGYGGGTLAWRAHSVGADRIAVVRDLQNIFYYQPSTHQWSQAPAIALADADVNITAPSTSRGGGTITVTTGTATQIAADSAVWTDSAGQAHVLIANFVEVNSNDPDPTATTNSAGGITVINTNKTHATIYDASASNPVATTSIDFGVMTVNGSTTVTYSGAGAVASPSIAVAGDQLYIRRNSTQTERCSLPALNDCVELGDMFHAVGAAKLALVGTTLYQIGGNVALSTDYVSGRDIQGFDTTGTPTPAIVLPPLFWATAATAQMAALSGKIYIASGVTKQLGVAVYTP